MDKEGNIRSSALANGVRIVTERWSGARAAAIGLCVQCGVRYERADESGYAHLLEHLLFRAAGADLALRFAAMGGEINAVTGRELLALHGFVLARHAAELVSHLAAMASAPAFSQGDLEHERAIIAWESRGFIDHDYAEQLLVEHVWRGHPIARALAGSRRSREQANVPRVREFWKRNFVGSQVWLFAVGAVEHERIVQAAQSLSRFAAGDAAQATAPEFHPGERRLQDADWMRLAWACPAPGLVEEDGDAFELLAYALGGHTQSPLNRALREDAALSYGPRARLIRYSDCGLLLVEATCASASAAHCRERVERLLDNIEREGFAPSEVAAAYEGLAVKRELQAERLDWRLESLAQRVIFRGTPAPSAPPAPSGTVLREAAQSLRQRFFLRAPA